MYDTQFAKQKCNVTYLVNFFCTFHANWNFSLPDVLLCVLCNLCKSMIRSVNCYCGADFNFQWLKNNVLLYCLITLLDVLSIRRLDADPVLDNAGLDWRVKRSISTINEGDERCPSHHRCSSWREMQPHASRHHCPLLHSRLPLLWQSTALPSLTR